MALSRASVELQRFHILESVENLVNALVFGRRVGLEWCLEYLYIPVRETIPSESFP